MSFVYFGAGRDTGRVVIAATNNLEERAEHHRQTDADFQHYRTLRTNHVFACEQYLDSLYAGRRLMAPANEPWFALDLDEVDHAIGLWERKEARFLDGSQRVASLKTFKTSDRST